MSRRPRASGYFRTDYAEDLRLLPTRLQRLATLAVLALLLALPLIASPFLIDLATQVCLAAIGALALMLLTGYAGQVSLGHAADGAGAAFPGGELIAASTPSDATMVAVVPRSRVAVPNPL